MAKRIETIEHFTDDLDGTKAEGTTSFSFDGQDFEIDLSKKNHAALEKALKPYIEGARHLRAARGRAAAKAKAKGGADRDRLAAIRVWAKAQGKDVADRGRIAQAIQDEYDAAH